MRHGLIKTLVAFTFFIVLAGGCFAADKSSEPIDDVMPIVLRPDLQHNLSVVWMSQEVWAAVGYADKDPKSRLVYYTFKSITDNYLVFLIIPDESNPDSPKPVIEGRPTLENDRGASVSAVPVNEGVARFFGDPKMFLAFPRRTADGKDIAVSGATLKLTLKYEGADEPGTYTWSLPLKFPDIVSKGIAALEKPISKPLADMSDPDEILSAFVAPGVRMSLEMGYAVSPMSADVMRALVASDGDLKDKKDLADYLAKSGNKYSFFFVLTTDDQTDRVEAVLNTAEAVNSNGQTVRAANDVRQKIVRLMGPATSDAKKKRAILVFPNLGAQGASSVRMTDKSTGNQMKFTWNLKPGK